MTSRLRMFACAAVFAFTAALPAVLPAPARAQDERVSELERKLDVLTQELDALRLGAVADTAARPRPTWLAPAAAKVYGIARGVSIGGYGEALYENFDREREDDAPSRRLDRIDFLRNVLYVGYKFDDQLLFNSEIEIEHGGVYDEGEVEGAADLGSGEVTGSATLSGEVVLEFAYVEWAPRADFGMRAGLLLQPLGLINEWHEPPTFIGSSRPDVERVIVPSTWRSIGIAAFGTLPGDLQWRVHAGEGLTARAFSASNGLRDGRQGGSRALGTQPAFSARVDWTGAAGLVLGAAGYVGDSWQDFQPAGMDVEALTTLWDVHGRWQWRGLELRGVYANGTLGDAGDVSDALGLAGDARLGESFWGAYAEAAYDVMPHLAAGSRWGLLPYARFETFDTQDDVPGGAENPANARTNVVAGAALKPHPNVVLKGDRQWKSNDADTGIPQWNLSVGYLF